MTSQDTQFDARLKAAWQSHADHVSGRTRLQLSPEIALDAARRRAMPSPRRHWLWPAATATATLALAIAVLPIPGLFDTAPATPESFTHSGSTTAPLYELDETDDSLLSGSPDFYAWLGSQEASLLAMESP